MEKLAAVLDQYDDGGTLLRKCFSEKGVPAIVKTAVDMSSPSRAHDEDYALVVDTEFGRERKYPCVDAGNTMASALYFGEYGHTLPDHLRKEAAQNISDALTSFGFTPPEEMTKSAAMELGYSGAADDMSLEALFGVTEDDQYRVVRDAFDDCSPRGKRRLMLEVKEAGLMDHAPEEIRDYSNEKIGSDLSVAIDTRKLCLLDPTAAEELDALMEKSASTDPDTLAEELQQFDVRHEITHLYERAIPDPYISVFGNSVKEKVASVEHQVEIGGTEYSPESIVSFSENGSGKIRDAFGEDFANQFSSDPVNVLASLPVTHKQAIARMIDEH